MTRSGRMTVNLRRVTRFVTKQKGAQFEILPSRILPKIMIGMKGNILPIGMIMGRMTDRRTNRRTNRSLISVALWHPSDDTSNCNYPEGLSNSTSTFPYRIGADRAEETANAARARAVKCMKERMFQIVV